MRGSKAPQWPLLLITIACLLGSGALATERGALVGAIEHKTPWSDPVTDGFSVMPSTFEFEKPSKFGEFRFGLVPVVWGRISGLKQKNPSKYSAFPGPLGPLFPNSVRERVPKGPGHVPSFRWVFLIQLIHPMPLVPGPRSRN